MNIWTFSHRFGAFLAVLLVAGCLAAPNGSKPRPGLTRAAPDTISVARGTVVIGGPQGYCIDRGASRLGGDTAFVLLGGCASITQDPEANAPLVPGLLTASVAKRTGAAPATDAALEQLLRFLVTPDGRATLARDGRAESVEMLAAAQESGAVLVYLRDISVNPTPGLEPAYWRGFFELNGRLITISVLGFTSHSLSAESGLALLRGFLSRIRDESPDKSVDVAAQPRRRLFPGLFN